MEETSRRQRKMEESPEGGLDPERGCSTIGGWKT